MSLLLAFPPVPPDGYVTVCEQSAELHILPKEAAIDQLALQVIRCTSTNCSIDICGGFLHVRAMELLRFTCLSYVRRVNMHL